MVWVVHADDVLYLYGPSSPSSVCIRFISSKSCVSTHLNRHRATVLIAKMWLCNQARFNFKHSFRLTRRKSLRTSWPSPLGWSSLSLSPELAPWLQLIRDRYQYAVWEVTLPIKAHREMRESFSPWSRRMSALDAGLCMYIRHSNTARGPAAPVTCTQGVTWLCEDSEGRVATSCSSLQDTSSFLFYPRMHLHLGLRHFYSKGTNLKPSDLESPRSTAFDNPSNVNVWIICEGCKINI